MPSLANLAMVNRTVEQIIRDTHRPQPLKGVYKSKVQTYKRWVLSSPDGEVVGGKFLTRDNVDKFFLLELRPRSDIQPQNLKQYRNALKAYSKNVEFPPGGPSFSVDSDAVAIACEQHLAQYQNERLQKAECSHSNLMANVLTEKDKLRLILAGTQRLTWPDYCTSQSTMNQTALRGCSLRLARLADIWYDNIHGPGDNPMLGVIEQDSIGKVKNLKKKVRGMWRHRSWELCGTGWMAASTIFRFAHDPFYLNMSFRHEDGDRTPPWYSLKIVSWNQYSPMYNAFTDLYKFLDISWAKCTHFRRQAIDDAQVNKASAANVSCQTGHAATGNMETFYALDSPPEVLHALSGFTQDDPYFCERWLIDVNDEAFPLIEGRTNTTADDLTRKLVPNYQQYLDDYNMSPVKWKSCETFLKRVLPFLCVIYVTDNPYRSRRLSDHSLTRHFNSIFGHRGIEWGNRQIESANEKMGVEKRDKIANADRSIQQMFLMIADQQLAASRKQEEEKRQADHERQQIRLFLQHTQRQLHLLVSGSTRDSIQAPALRNLPPARARITVPNAPPQENRQEQRQRQNLERYAPNVTLPRPSAAAPALPIPSIPSKIPAKAVDVLQDHLRLQLERYRNVPKSKAVWGSAAMRYSRRLKCYKIIGGRAASIRGQPDRGAALLEAARRIDQEKGDQSFASYLDSNDTAKKGRKSNQRGVRRPRLVLNGFF
jgi:hypothetical protein